MIDHPETKIFEVPALSNVTDWETELFCSELETFLQSLESNLSLVIFFVPTLPKKSPVQATKQAGFLDVARRSILLFRRALDALNSCPYPSVYVGLNNCLSRSFDLALSCSYRVWFGEGGHVGYPEILSNCYPTGAAMTNRRVLKLKGLESWHKDPLVSIDKAVNIGLIDAYLGSTYQFDHPLAWSKQNIPLSSDSSDRATQEKKPVDRFDCLDWQDALNMEKSWQKRKKSPQSIGAWEYAVSLHQDKGQDLKERDFENLFALSTGRQVATSINRRENEFNLIGAQLTKNSPIQIEESAIYIDCSEWAPPISVLGRLLCCDYRIVFFAQKQDNWHRCWNDSTQKFTAARKDTS